MRALQKKERNVDPRTKKRVKAVFDFNPLLPKISNVLKKHHRTMLTDNPELRDAFPDPPMACLRQGPNLRRLLCKSSLTTVTRPTRATHRSAAGWKRCSHISGRQCAKCPYTPPTASSIISHITGLTTSRHQSHVPQKMSFMFPKSFIRICTTYVYRNALDF